jgi:hypothetical protein
MKCPACNNEMEPGFLYVRGFGGSLFWSNSKETGFFSRKDLEQVDLSKLSVTGTAIQGVLAAFRCSSCKYVLFKSE